MKTGVFGQSVPPQRYAAAAFLRPIMIDCPSTISQAEISAPTGDAPLGPISPR